MDEKVKKQVSAAIKKMMMCPSLAAAGVLMASLLAAIFFACVYAGGAALNIYVPPAPSHAASFLGHSTILEVVPHYKVTAAADVGALLRGLLWCSAPQGAAAVLALLLPGRRCCLALAFVALAATAVNHWMYAKLLGLIARADFLVAATATIVFTAAVLDVLGFLSLLVFVLGVGGPRQAEQASKV